MNIAVPMFNSVAVWTQHLKIIDMVVFTASFVMNLDYLWMIFVSTAHAFEGKSATSRFPVTFETKLFVCSYLMLLIAIIRAEFPKFGHRWLTHGYLSAMKALLRYSRWHGVRPCFSSAFVGAVFGQLSSPTGSKSLIAHFAYCCRVDILMSPSSRTYTGTATPCTNLIWAYIEKVLTFGTFYGGPLEAC